MKLQGQEAIERETELRDKIYKLEQRLAVLGDVPDPQENTLFSLSAHHTWHHEQERQLRDRIEAAQKVLETIVCTVPPDDGVVLLSNEAPAHWDDEANCSVYEHEHFSPLGDALIKLRDALAGTETSTG